MASQLHEAVRLAQAGNRQDARRLLWQVVQDEPNNEIAWLWLASVAADLPEYERALTEVLRINPGHQQARQLLKEYREQYGALPPAQQPVTPPYAAQPSPQTPPPAQYPPSRPQPPVYGYPAAPSGYGPEYPAAPVQPRPAPPERGARFPGCLAPMGCGCGGGCLRGCLLTLFIIVILPAILCGAVSYFRFSFGPVDLPMAYLPGDFGRKDVDFTLEAAGDSGERRATYDVSVTVPRSWFPAVEQNQWWVTARDLLDDFVTPAEATASWHDLGVDLDAATPTTAVNIIETDPFRLRTGGSYLLLTFEGIAPAATACADVERDLPADAELVRRGSLCGVRVDATQPVGENVFRDFDPPSEIRIVTFSVPVDESLAANWIVELPAEFYAEFEDDINRIVDSAQVEAR